MRIASWMAKHTDLFIRLFAAIMFFIISSQFIAIGFPTSKAYTVFSIVFDVNQMKSANKMTIQTPGGITTITDKALIRKVVKETTVHNSMGVGCFSWGNNVNPNVNRVGNEICLYQDDILIRRMPQSWQADGCWDDLEYSNFRAVKLYEKDAFHFILGANEIWAYLPVDLVKELEKALQAQGNSYFTD